MNSTSQGSARFVRTNSTADTVRTKQPKRQCKKTVRSFYNAGTVTFIVELYISRARVRQERRDIVLGGASIADLLAEWIGGTHGVLAINFTKHTKHSDAARVDTAIITVTASKAGKLRGFVTQLAERQGISSRVRCTKAEDYPWQLGNATSKRATASEITVDQIMKKWGHALKFSQLPQSN
jgi:hypothetical protein